MLRYSSQRRRISLYGNLTVLYFYRQKNTYSKYLDRCWLKNLSLKELPVLIHFIHAEIFKYFFRFPLKMYQIICLIFIVLDVRHRCIFHSQDYILFHISIEYNIFSDFICFIFLTFYYIVKSSTK